MSSDTTHREFLIDSYALAYIHSLEEKDLVVLFLSKFVLHISTLSLQEFLTYVHFKSHDYTKIASIAQLFSKVYIIEDVDINVIIKASLITSDFLKHEMSYNITDVINAAISLIKNIPILTDDPERYKAYFKYGIIAYSIEELINRFKKLLEEGKDRRQ